VGPQPLRGRFPADERLAQDHRSGNKLVQIVGPTPTVLDAIDENKRSRYTPIGSASDSSMPNAAAVSYRRLGTGSGWSCRKRAWFTVTSGPLINVMLTRTGAKLLGFNIASRVGDPVYIQSGTPPYQAPDARPYSLGCLHRPVRSWRDALGASLQWPATLPGLEADGRRVGGRPEDNPIGPERGSCKITRKGLSAVPQ